MISSRWRIMKHLAKLYDLSTFIAGFIFISFVLNSPSHRIQLADFMAVRIKLGNCVLFALLLLVWHNILILSGVYVSKRLVTRFTEAVDVCKATLLACLFLFLSTKALHLQWIGPRFILALWVVCTMAMVAGRVVARSLLFALRRRGRNSRFLLIVGTNARAIEFAEQTRKRPELGYNIVGFVDDDWAGIQGFEASGQSRCCTFSGLAEFLRHNVVDEAAIYLPLRSYYEHAAELASLCEQHGIVIRIWSQIFKLRGADAAVLDVDEYSRVVALSGSSGTWAELIKRLIDCVGSVVLIALLAPLLLLVSLVVKFTSTGPVFFRQTRVGLNKRQFCIYKFRTMIAEAEQVQDQFLCMNEMTGPVFKIKKDPRVTPLGRILRKSSIDELPQLFNVLKGEMSLVGPRAMSLRDYQLFEEDWQRRRFSVKPGITCLWQVQGRNSIPFEKWMELDLQYIDKWSLWLDLKILAQTVPAVLRGSGAA
jgi:exopolysaccharide biosynthesis polyprenyl glycosylphosphotransferase